MIRIKYIILSFLGLLFSSSLFSQDDVDVIILDQAETGATHTHVAREQIKFKPGYQYSAQQDAHVRAYIDEWLSVDTDYSDMFTDTTFDREIDTSLPVALTSGSHGVSPTGGASYTFPIEALPGISGMEPQVSLVYNSQSGTGIAGFGWNISGLSSISRTGKNIYFDGVTAPITLTESDDRYVIDGQRLIKESGSYGSSGVYKTESENFTRITAIGDSGSGPSKFKVETKDGMTLWFGEDSNSQIRDGSGSAILSWRISKTIDRHGNYIVYEYDNSSQESRIKRILYTGNVGAGREPFQSVNFYYDLREDINSIFAKGTEFKQNHILSGIELKHNDNSVREYKLDYAKDQYSYLQEVKETDRAGNELNSLRFKYNIPDSPLVLGQSHSLPFNMYGPYYSKGDLKIYTGDFNGDGLTDMLRSLGSFAGCYETLDADDCKENFSLYINENGTLTLADEISLDNPSILANQYVETVNIPEKASMVGDVDGDGIDEVIVVTGGAANLSQAYAGIMTIDDFTIMSYDSSSGITTSSISPPSGYGKIVNPSKRVRIADFDGDGMKDIYALFRKSTAAETKAFICRPGVSNSWKEVSFMDFSDFDSLWPIDFDGDGKSELMVVENGETSSKVFSFNPSSFTAGLITHNILYHEAYPSFYDSLYPGDFNGDGITDFLASWNSGVDWKVTYGTGSGYQAESFNHSLNKDELYIFDIDSDGKSDIVSVNTGIMEIPTGGLTPDYWVHSKLDIYTSTGVDFEFETYPFQEAANKKLLVGDFNGDGYPNLLSPGGAYDFVQGNTTLNYSISSQIFKYRENVHGRTLHKVLDGFNGETAFDYTQLSQDADYEKGANSIFPVIDFQGAFAVVNRVSTSNGIGGMNSVSYKYDKARIHLQGKGFLGFSTVEVLNETSGTRTVTNSILDIDNSNGQTASYFVPLSTTTEVYSNQNNLLSSSSVDYELIELGDQRFWHLMVQSDQQNHITGEQSQTVINDHDTDGNIKKKTTNQANLRSTIETYSNFVSNGSWLPTHPEDVEIKTTVVNEVPYIRKTSFTYNTNGSVETKVIDPLSDRPVTTEYGYNSLGLLAFEETSSPATADYGALPTKSTVTLYSDYGYPIRITITGGDYNEFEYDPITGQLVWEKGVTGLLTNYQYDSLGRLKRTTDPLGRNTYSNYYWDVGNTTSTGTRVGNSIFYTSTDTDGGTESRKWFDRLGRVRKSELDGFNGGVIRTVTTYDESGRIDSETTPFYDGEAYNAVITTHEYHSEYQMIESSSNSIGTVSTSYDLSGGLFAITKTSMTGVNTMSYLDASGRLVKSQDEGGTVEQKYYANGQIKEVKVNGLVTSTMEYDDWGNKTKLEGVNAGLIEYNRNAYGQLFWQKNANNHIAEFFYDEKGRMDYEETPDGTIDYLYENSVNGKNKLKKIIGVNGEITKEYTYDQYSRTIEETENLVTDGILMTTSLTYDNLGRVKNITYPSGVTTTNSYIEPDGGDRGFLTSVSIQGQSEPIYQINSINSLGQITEYSNGNGLITTNEIDKHGFLKHKQISDMVDIEYDYELTTGNMSFRQNNSTGLKELFEFDDLNRLKESKIVDLVDESITLHTQTQSYSDNGNIDVKSDVGSYNYNTEKINAIHSIEDVGCTTNFLQAAFLVKSLILCHVLLL